MKTALLDAKTASEEAAAAGLRAVADAIAASIRGRYHQVRATRGRTARVGSLTGGSGCRRQRAPEKCS